MIQFSTTILQFDKKGEKTGWSYIEINSIQAQQLNAGCKVSFRVKGKIDALALQKVAILPMGNGSFILPLNSAIRKAIQKQRGDKAKVTLELDKGMPVLSKDLLVCLAEDTEAMTFFKSLPKSHQNYFSKWIESAKTASTKTKRIVMTINALEKKQGFNEMIRANRNNPD